MPYPNTRKKISEKQAFDKISNFCAYQERSQKEVLEKLYEFGMTKDVAEQIINRLISENFLNEERFAKTFTRGKFRIKKWGKNKIKAELSRKGVSNEEILNSLQEIDEENYQESLKSILEKKNNLLKEDDPIKRMQKLAAFGMRKGYEPDIVWDEVKQLLNN